MGSMDPSQIYAQQSHHGGSMGPSSMSLNTSAHNQLPPNPSFPPGLLSSRSETNSNGRPSIRPSLPALYASHEYGSVSPNDFPQQASESMMPVDYAAMNPAAAHISSIMLHNPKRAYRQRRKDPSCDACRERKVKCDATETSSCTECSSRNVRCQFTKETNRRMSSIKVVQDLERQLQETRQQLNRLRATISHTNVSPTRPNAYNQKGFIISPISQASPELKKTPLSHRYTRARIEMLKYGHALVRPRKAENTSAHRISNDVPQLPAQQLAEHAIMLYRDHFHRRFPFLHWHTFRRTCESLYARQEVGQEAVSIFFCVLACGALCSQRPHKVAESMEYLRKASSTQDAFQDIDSLDRVVVKLLTSIVLIEIGRVPTAWTWLGSAIRGAQSLNFHLRASQSESSDQECRIWYTLYCWDRFLAAELGNSAMINDEDFDNEHPTLFEEDFSFSDTTQPDQPTFLIASSNLARLIKPLNLMFTPRGLSNDLLRSYAENLAACMQTLPSDFQLSSSLPLDPINLPTITAFQNTRLLVYRQNLSPQCSQEQRLQAVDQCVNVACDTASFMKRCMCVQPQFADWQTRLAASASTLLCTHLWRCTLFTIHRGFYEAALTLIRSLTIIGDAKAVTDDCGRYISFFLRQMMATLEKSSSPAQLDTDEDLLAYLSADLQSDSRRAWIWGEGETQDQAPPTPFNSYLSQPPIASTSISKERNDWGGWKHIEEIVQQLQLQQKAQPRPMTTQAHQQPRNRMDIAHIT